MPRLWERVYPYVITVLLVLIYRYMLSSLLDPILQSNTTNIINSIITISSILLSFVGVMLGVLISVKNTAIVKVLDAQNALSDLMRYVKEACFFGETNYEKSSTF